jgi:hypothetical protein
MEGDRELKSGGRARRSLSRRPIGLPAFLVILALAVNGCGDDEQGPVGPGDPAPTYLAPTSPQNVLRNLVTAYGKRDSVQTALMYDDGYEGTSIDPSGIIGDFAFTKADEVHHVAVLKLDPNVVSVLVDLGNPASWTRLGPDPSDPPDWAQIQINFATIRVDDISTATTHEALNQAMIYKFKPAVAAPGDTTWKVVAWTEFVTIP